MSVLFFLVTLQTNKLPAIFVFLKSFQLPQKLHVSTMFLHAVYLGATMSSSEKKKILVFLCYEESLLTLR
jgi:hypothetical protein